MAKKKPAVQLAEDTTQHHSSWLIWVGSAVLLLLSFLLIWYATQHRDSLFGSDSEPYSMSEPGSLAEPISEQGSEQQETSQPEQQEFSAASEPEEELVYLPVSTEPLAPIDPNERTLQLVDSDHPLAEDFTVDLFQFNDGVLVEKNVAPMLKMMLQDAAQEGINLEVVSGYRSIAQQQELVRKASFGYVLSGLSIEEALQQAGKLLGQPGADEHHTGLTVDITSADYQGLDAGFANTAAYRWLFQNAYRYGFVLRYPKEKQEITGQEFRPWQYRFVGVENAVAMYRHALCLEEYLEQAPRKL